MDLLGSIVGAIFNPASLFQLALGPAGWAGLALQTVGASIGQEVIEQVGQKLNLSRGEIATAQDSFTQASGMARTSTGVSGAVQELGEKMGASASEIGNAQRDSNEVVKQLVDSVLKKARESDGEGGSSAGESRLVKLAKAMGKLLDKKMDKIIEVGEKMDGAKKQGSLSAEMQALSQEMSMISNAINNMVKSIGEANTTLVRKS